MTLLKRTPRRSGAPGYTLIEALLLSVILSTIAVGVGNSIIATSNSTEANENTLQIDSTLVTQMETIRATWKSYPLGQQNLSSIIIGNTTYTPTMNIVQLASGFFSIDITIAGRTISTCVSN